MIALKYVFKRGEITGTCNAKMVENLYTNKGFDKN